MNKAIIYLRTSTKDQNPELQKKDCLEFCKGIGLEVAGIVQEQGSAYKIEKVRPLWESVIGRAKIEKLHIVLWKYDRSFRNREEFYKFMKVMFEVYHLRVYSATEPSILSFWDMMNKEKSGNPIFDELLNSLFKAIWDFMIQNAGEQAEEESKKKSERVKLAVRKKKGKTVSYKGNLWGRKGISKNTINEIIEKHNNGITMRQISKEVHYWDKNKNKKYVSLGFVHKIISDFTTQKSS